MRRALRCGTLTLTRHRVTAEFLTQVVATTALLGSLAWLTWQTTRGVVTLGDLADYYPGSQTGLTLLQTVLRAVPALYEDNLFLTNLYQFLDL